MKVQMIRALSMAGLGAALLFSTAAHADETGLAGIHDQAAAKGRRVCMTDHFHDGSGQGRTRKEAEAKAVQAWIDFTAFEYGGTWGSFQLAEARTMNCSEAGSNWSCMASARPCKRDVRPGKAVPQTARN
jgi:hypothetical protein